MEVIMTSKRVIMAGLDLSDKTYLIKRCKRCNAEIIWLQSKKGKYYPVNFVGLIDVAKNDFHKCGQNPLLGCYE